MPGNRELFIENTILRCSRIVDRLNKIDEDYHDNLDELLEMREIVDLLEEVNDELSITNYELMQRIEDLENNRSEALNPVTHNVVIPYA